MTPSGANPTTRFAPVSGAWHQMTIPPIYLTILSINFFFNFGALHTHFNTFWQFNGNIDQFWVPWMSVIGNVELYHTKSPHFWLGPHRITPFRISIPTDPYWWGGGQACSEHLALPHFCQNNLALARNWEPLLYKMHTDNVTISWNLVI